MPVVSSLLPLFAKPLHYTTLGMVSLASLAAFQRARTLFPFPILGIDTDNGGEAHQ
jgi:hypothetical protein